MAPRVGAFQRREAADYPGRQRAGHVPLPRRRLHPGGQIGIPAGISPRLSDRQRLRPGGVLLQPGGLHEPLRPGKALRLCENQRLRGSIRRDSGGIQGQQPADCAQYHPPGNEFHRIRHRRGDGAGQPLHHHPRADGSARREQLQPADAVRHERRYRAHAHGQAAESADFAGFQAQRPARLVLSGQSAVQNHPH